MDVKVSYQKDARSWGIDSGNRNKCIRNKVIELKLRQKDKSCMPIKLTHNGRLMCFLFSFHL